MPLGFSVFICKMKLRNDICKAPKQHTACNRFTGNCEILMMRVMAVVKISAKPDVSRQGWRSGGLVEKTQPARSLQPATPQRLSLGTLKKHLKKNYSYALKAIRLHDFPPSLNLN